MKSVLNTKVHNINMSVRGWADIFIVRKRWKRMQVEASLHWAQDQSLTLVSRKARQLLSMCRYGEFVVGAFCALILW